MQDLEETLERLFQTAWSLQPGPVRIQIFSELEQFRFDLGMDDEIYQRANLSSLLAVIGRS